MQALAKRALARGSSRSHYLKSSGARSRAMSGHPRPKLMSLSDVEHLTSSLVLHRDDNFLVINKPHDVRMDGDYELTVEKLLLAKCSPPSSAVSSINDSEREKRIEGFKWVHQLDFATSGTLLVAMNRKAAASASKAFSEREVQKEYCALVYGHVLLGDRWSRILPSDIIDYRERAKLEWKEMDESIKTCKSVLKEAPGKKDINTVNRDEILSKCLAVLSELPDESDQLGEIALMKSESVETFTRSYKLRKQLRKLLKRLGKYPDDLPSSDPVPKVNAKRSLVENTNYEFNHTISDAALAENVYVFYSEEKKKDLLLVTVPTAEVPEQFPCEFGRPSNPGKYAETELEVLGYGSYKGQLVTKLRLYPRTGRRHQLRLHCLALGHPIVGDCTYANAKHYPEVAERMMLHSMRLRVPVEGWADRSGNAVVGNLVIDVSTEDPYVGMFVESN